MADYMTNNKRFFAIMGSITIVIILAVWIRSEFSNIAQQQIITINETLRNTTEAVKLNADNQKVLAHNEKVIAKGINDLGGILISEVKEIGDKADLIDDIKFDVSQILNVTVHNVTIGSGSANISVPIINLTK